MKKIFSILFVMIAVIGVILGLVEAALGSQGWPEPPKPMIRKIIIFKSGILNEPAQEALVEKFGGVKIKDLTLIDGKAVLLPPQAALILAQEEGVLRVDDDVEVEALEKGGISGRPAFPQPSQVLPWGIDRVEADLVWGTTTGDPIKVAIVDTGIDLAHPDLKDNIKGGYNAINPWQLANDDNGHGTHVAGIVAAANNTIGVVGVGPNIDLYAVKVLDRRGSGYLSDVIEGLDWAIQNGMQVVNMSLGTSSDIQSFREAVQRVNAAGIVQVVAAGNNSGGSVSYPAAYPEVIAVSATDSSDNIAYFSSVGSAVDLAAPGVSIYSAYKSSTYKTLSGTSMATPHVTGTAALVLTVPQKCDLDYDSKCSPQEVQQRLESTAIDLGVPGKDILYGSGLVNAYRAVTQ